MNQNPVPISELQKQTGRERTAGTFGAHLHGVPQDICLFAEQSNLNHRNPGESDHSAIQMIVDTSLPEVSPCEGHLN